jgi:chromosome segregation ATPase
LTEENRFLQLTLERQVRENEEKDVQSGGAQERMNELKGLAEMAQGESAALKEHVKLLEASVLEKDHEINELKEDVRRSEEEARLLLSERDAVKQAMELEGQDLKAQLNAQTEELKRLREYREYSKRQLDQTEAELAENTTELHRARVEVGDGDGSTNHCFYSGVALTNICMKAWHRD